MNRLEHFFCSTSLWQRLTHRLVLPWIFSGARLGEHVLEIGAGYGPAIGKLLQLAPQVTALDYDAQSLARLKANHNQLNLTALRGDATQLPFDDQSFSSAVAILVLHHLKNRELQDRMFAEVHRVLRPGGSFFAAEITDGWLNRAVHYRSTFTPLAPASAFARLTAAGFSRVSVDFRKGGFRIRARKAVEAGVPANEQIVRSVTA
jgi:ubiquinone/menaquinone biosynthesis C-methylase UbiE